MAKKKTGKAYKLFKLKDGKLYPLYVLANAETVMDKWLPAESGEMTRTGKVKSKLGPLCYRPGWHCSDVPTCSHIGIMGCGNKLYQARDTVWAEVEYSAEIDYREEAYKNGIHPNTGKFVARDAQLRKIPENGFYTYKTNPNMTGEWIIAGEIKVKRVLTRKEQERICKRHGVEVQPMWGDWK